MRLRLASSIEAAPSIIGVEERRENVQILSLGEVLMLLTFLQLKSIKRRLRRVP
jgi:hypothetical protein